MQDMVQPLRQALTIGLQQPQLATAALRALERWESGASAGIDPDLISQVCPTSTHRTNMLAWYVWRLLDADKAKFSVYCMMHFSVQSLSS